MLLSDRLHQSMVTYRMERQEERFIPTDKLNELITETNISEQLYSQSGSHPQQVLVHLKGDKIKRITKILGILGLSEIYLNLEVLVALFQDKICDDNLPLEHVGGKLQSISSGELFNEFSTSLKSMGIRKFLDDQSTILSPFFSGGGEHIQSRDLRISLPLRAQKLVARTGFSLVHKATIDDSHRARHIDGVVAIKQLYDIESFKKEMEILKHLRDVKTRHLIKHISTIAWGDRCFILFPWAIGGNLRDFWAEDEYRDARMCSWALDQMLGVTEALSELYDLNCRHGDLKPENILLFDTDGSKRLVISDVGLAKIHMRVTDARPGRTTTYVFTHMYEAPDQIIEDGKPLSRRFDSWSLGCILLEFIIWLLYGPEELEQFSRARTTHVDKNCRFYETIKHGVVVHSAVGAWAKSMQEDDPRCAKGKTGFGDLLSIVIEKLLQIKHERRADPKSLSENIKRLIQRASGGDSYVFTISMPENRAPCRPSTSLKNIINEMENSRSSSFYTAYKKHRRRNKWRSVRMRIFRR